MFRKTSLYRVRLLGVIVSALFATACPQPYSLQELVDGPDGRSLTISPTSALLQINDSLPIETTGGIPPYTYSVVSGSGSFIGNVYTAPPSPGTETIRISDKAGTSREVVITIENATGVSLGITPASGTVFTGGTIDFDPIGGTGSPAFALTTNVSGGNINASTGVYTAGSAPGVDVVTITDAPDSATATITVQAKPLSISPETITVYVNQVVNFSAVGGDGLFSYAIGVNGSGATMIGNVYTAGSNPGTDTVVMTDDYDNRTRTATITVTATQTGVDYEAMPVTITDPGDLLAGTNFDAQFSIVNNGGAGGAKPINWTVYASADTAIGGTDDRIAASGNIPGGTGAGSTTPVPFSGTWPSEAGNYFLLVEVYAADDLSPADNRNQSAGQTQVYEPVRISPAVAAVSTGGTVVFTVTGGTGSYSYAFTGTGSGVPSIAGDTYTAGALSGSDIVEVTADGHPTWPAATATITVQEKTLSISPAAITVYVNQPVTFSSVGGTGPFSYAITANGSGGAMVGAVYTAGPNPGTDTVTLTDTSDSRTRPAVVTVVDTATNVDYAATAITNIVPVDILTGSGFNAEFSIVNNGAANGSKTISWTVYTSTDTAIGGADDRIAASGSLAGKPAGSTTPVAFGGVWPSEAGNYYLLVEISAADDLAPADNRNGSAGQTQIYRPLAISPVLASIYTGQTVNFAASGGTGSYLFALTTNDSGGTVNASSGAYTAGVAAGTDIIEVSDTAHPGWTAAVAAISVALTPPPPAGDVEYTVSSFTAVDTTPNAGSPIGESFTLRNNGTDPGSASVNWAVYLSQNNTPAFTVGDQIAGSGSVSALAGNDGFAGGPDETPVPITGSWPSLPGTWYLKVKEWADDETTPNQWFVSSSFSVQSVSVDVDYYVSTPPAGGIGVSLNDPVSASFIVTNLGADGGTADVFWYAYISTDTVYSAGDTLVDAGSFGALPSGGNSGAVPINSGTWSEVGNRYLVVRLQSSDETYTVNNVRASGAAYAVTNPAASAPDYIVGAVSRIFPIATADSAVSETFTITNMGTAGASDVYWTAYASTDTVLGGDTVIGSGTIAGGLPAGASASGIAINGFWPNLAANFYIIIQVDAADETNHNDVGISADSFNIKWPPDYLITGTVFTAINNGGNINETLQSAGGGVRPGFRIRENNGQSGLYTITWRAYRSTDQNLGGDTQVAYGTIPALAAGQTSSLIEFNDTLPATRGVHYYIIQVSSPDDRDLTNNVLVSPAMYVWSDGDSADGTADGADGDNSETDIDQNDNSPSLADDFLIKLNPGDSVRIDGLIDAYASNDLFLVRTGPGTTSLNISMTWATGTDDLDLYIFDHTLTQIASSIDTFANSEPAAPPKSVPVSANATYYIMVNSWLANNTPPAKNNSPGMPYTLRVTAP